MDRLALFRGVVVVLVGAFLVIYAAVSSPLNRAVVGVAGLVLLGVISLDSLLGRRRD